MSGECEYGLEVPDRVIAWFKALPREEQYQRGGHPLGGTGVERQSVGDPGHCDICAVFGHLVAHPGYGCADVGCGVPAADHEPATTL